MKLTKPIAHAAGALLLLSACTPAPNARAQRELDAQIEALVAKEEIRSVLLEFSHVIDSADVSALAQLEPRLLPDFSMNVVDFAGGELQFVGIQGLVEGFGPIMLSAQANLAPSAIAVDIDQDHAIAFFKFTNAVVAPPELGLELDQKVLLTAANTATFVRVGGVWMLESLELVHSRVY